MYCVHYRAAIMMNGGSIGAHWKGCETWQPCRILRDLAGEIWSLRIWHVIDNPRAVVPGRGWHARSAWCDLEKRPRRVIIRYRASLPKAPRQRARAGLTISPSAQPACLRIVIQCCSSCPLNAFIPGMHQLHTMLFMTPPQYYDRDGPLLVHLPLAAENMTVFRLKTIWLHYGKVCALSNQPHHPIISLQLNNFQQWLRVVKMCELKTALNCLERKKK